jgi:hypothetical protein
MKIGMRLTPRKTVAGQTPGYLYRRIAQLASVLYYNEIVTNQHGGERWTLNILSY